MARARMYNVVEGKAPRRQPTGQAARVFEELKRDTTPRTAEDIDKAIRTSDRPHKTVQDSLRVTLYYILIFKKMGVVAAVEQPVTDGQETGGAAMHGSSDVPVLATGEEDDEDDDETEDDEDEETDSDDE